MRAGTRWTGALALLLGVVGLCRCGGGGGSLGEGDPTPSEPFRLLSAHATSPSQVRLQFSSAVDASTVSQADQFRIVGLVHFGAAVDPADGSRVLVDTFFQLNDTYEVQALAARSASGRALEPGSESASFPGAGAPAHVRLDLAPPADLADLLGAGWTIVDDPAATVDTPSAWAVSGGAILQSSNIFGGDSGDARSAERPGTILVHTAEIVQDGFIRATLASGDDDGLGLIVRYTDPDNYYRFEWDRQRRRQRIVRVAAGVSTVLASDTTRYDLDTDYEITLCAVGTRLAVLIDGTVVLSVRDGTLASGSAGIYCWGNDAIRARNVVVTSVAGPLTAAVGGPDRIRPDAPVASHAPVAHDPAPDGALLWVRAAEECMVHWEVSTDPDFGAGRLVSAPQSALTTSDLTVQHVFDGLVPDTRYFARAILVDSLDATRRNASGVVTFRTAPAHETREDVVFAFGADLHQDYPERLGILAGLAARQPSFFVSLGDFPYADEGIPSFTVEACRTQYQLVRSFDAVESCFQAVPLVATWDDHEVANDWDGATSAALVSVGTQVWKEYFPYRPVVGSGGATYRSIRWGLALELFLLDTRFHRDANADPDTASKTMLGTAQKQWLLQGLSDSVATFKVIATSVPLRFGTTGNDHWAGFTTERAEILAHITSNAIPGVLFLAGDQHWAAVHHHPEGLTEVMACPLNAKLRDPPAAPPPEVVFVRKDYCYGLVRIDAAAQTCRVELYDADDVLIHVESLP